jgi:hypothetical protein
MNLVKCFNDQPGGGWFTLEQAKPHIQRRETAIKTTPLSTLEPLCGWTVAEKASLWQHINAPSKFRPHPDTTSWIE